MLNAQLHVESLPVSLPRWVEAVGTSFPPRFCHPKPFLLPQDPVIWNLKKGLLSEGNGNNAQGPPPPRSALGMAGTAADIQ